MSRPAVSLGGASSLLDPMQVQEHYRDVLPPSVRGALESVHLDLLHSCQGPGLVEALRQLVATGRASTRAWLRRRGV